MSRIAAIVLAAGTSARMGPENKLLADLAGEPVLRRTVSNVLTSRARPVIVVTGHDAALVGEALEGLAVSLVHNDRFAEGMATSLAAGVAAVPADADGALICLGDMPLVEGNVIDALIDAGAADEGRSVAVPVHAGQRGHPVLWGRRYFTALQRLTGDAGARSLLEANAGQVMEVDIGDDTIFADADT
ncbi:MAG: nucleotidyltransferase family protein, partial [Aestuariivirgaceae bacterium]